MRLHLSSDAAGRKGIFLSGTLELNMSLKMKEQYNFRKYLSTCNFIRLQRTLYLPLSERGSSDSFKALSSGHIWSGRIVIFKFTVLVCLWCTVLKCRLDHKHQSGILFFLCWILIYHCWNLSNSILKVLVQDVTCYVVNFTRGRILSNK